MKYLVVLLVIVVVAWLLLRARSRDRASRAAPGSQGKAHRKAREVVACRHCGLHLPRDEAVADASGTYCSHEHRIAGPRPP